LLIADYAPTRLSVRLAVESDYEICAEAATAEETIRAAEREQPDLCVIGQELPGGGLAAVRGVSEVAPTTAVVVLTAGHDVDDLLELIRAGAVGYISSAASPDALRRVFGAVAGGEAAVPRSLVLDLVREVQGATTAPGGLTAREAQVLRMLRRRHSTAAIAERLGISPVTVRRHVSALLQKTGADDRSALSLDDTGAELAAARARR
jgi:DNA-binding NarL/FixJ family response regulator